MIPPPKVCPPPYCEGADICPPPVRCFKSCSTICEEFQISLPAEVLAFCWLTRLALFWALPVISPSMPETRLAAAGKYAMMYVLCYSCAMHLRPVPLPCRGSTTVRECYRLARGNKERPHGAGGEHTGKPRPPDIDVGDVVHPVLHDREHVHTCRVGHRYRRRGKAGSRHR